MQCGSCFSIFVSSFSIHFGVPVDKVHTAFNSLRISNRKINNKKKRQQKRALKKKTFPFSIFFHPHNPLLSCSCL